MPLGFASSTPRYRLRTTSLKRAKTQLWSGANYLVNPRSIVMLHYDDAIKGHAELIKHKASIRRQSPVWPAKPQASTVSKADGRKYEVGCGL